MLSIVLIGAIAGAIGAVSYVMATSKVEEKFTEFYALGPEGKAIDYPQEIKVGGEGRVIVGIVNREQETVNYWVEVRIDGVMDNQLGPLELDPDEKWEESVSFTPDRTGEHQKVEFILYKNRRSEPYRELHLWINVGD